MIQDRSRGPNKKQTCILPSRIAGVKFRLFGIWQEVGELFSAWEISGWSLRGAGVDCEELHVGLGVVPTVNVNDSSTLVDCMELFGVMGLYAVMVMTTVTTSG